MALADEIVARFADIIKVPKETVDLDKDLVDVYNIDSVKALRLISDVEVEYEINIGDDEARQVQTLNDVIALIASKRR